MDDDDSSKPGGDRPGSRLSVPSTNPLPLSASQESEVRELYYARVRRKCDDEIKAFANCTKNRTFSISWACRDQYRVMNSCMLSHATQAEQDASREEWFALRMERVRDRERKARRKAEQERFHREWWGLPDKDPELKKRAEDKLKLTERVGGFAAKDRPPAGGAPQEQKGL